MRKEIDWSKAPEGATHYNPQCGDWYMVDSDCVSYWSYSHRNWLESAHWNARRAFCIARPTTPSYSGEGLPPVGVVCEANFVGNWTEFELRYYGESYVIFKTRHEVQRTRIDFDTCGVKFRPIRTPEQIAAVERELSAMALFKMIEGNWDWPSCHSDHKEKYYRAVDDGWRKP